MRAIILAGGKGTRLKPYTTSLPKPLMPIGGEFPILEIVIKQLKRDGFKHVTMAVNHMANIIMAFFGDGKKWDMKIDYSVEEKPLGTIAPLTLLNDLPDNFLVMNGDVFTDINYADVFDSHMKNNNDITVTTYKRGMNIAFGELTLNEKDSVVGFKEKPTYYFNVGVGINIINKKVIDNLSKNKPYGFDNLILDGIENDLRIKAYMFSGLWLDIGRPEDYDKANEIWETMKHKLLHGAKR